MATDDRIWIARWVTVVAAIGLTAPAAIGAFDTSNLTGAWQLHGLISGDNPDQHPGWYWMSLAFDAAGNASATSNIHDSLGNTDYRPTFSEGFRLDPFGRFTTPRISSFRGEMNIGKDLIVTTATMAPGDASDVRGYNLQVLVKSGATFAMSDLGGTWRMHGLVSGDAPDWLGWYRLDVTIGLDGVVALLPGSYRTSSGATDQPVNFTLSLTSQGVVTVAGRPDWHGTVSDDKSLLVMTMNAPDGGYQLCIAQRQSTQTFAAADLAGVWHLHGLATGDGPHRTGWFRGDVEVRSSGAFALSSVNSDGSVNRVTDTVHISNDGVVTFAGRSSAHGVMSDDKNLQVLTMTADDGGGGYDLILLTRAATTLSSRDYGAGTPATHGVKTFEWTYGRTGQWTSQITRYVTVPYWDGARTGVEVSNAFEVNGNLWSEVVHGDGSVIRALALGNFYLSSDEYLSSHPDAWSFGAVTDGMLLNLSPYYLINKNNWSQVVPQENQMLLYHVQNIKVLKGEYTDALTVWTIDTRYPFVALNLFGKETELGLVLPTALETGGHAVTQFRMRARQVGIIGHGRIDPSTGQLLSLGELQNVVPPAAFTIGGIIYRNVNDLAAGGLGEVSVAVSGPGGLFTTTTNENGLWSVSGVPECTYTVTPSKEGYPFVHLVNDTPDGNDYAEIVVNQANEGANTNIQFAAVVHELTANVVGGNGTVAPTQGTYGGEEVVTLKAVPDAGYCVKAWIGTDNDSLTSSTNTVTMASDRTVTVEFAPAGLNDPDGYLRQGYQDASAGTLSGLRQAYHYFHLARGDSDYESRRRESILLDALARLAMLFVDTEDVYIDTSLLELVQLCGVEVMGDALDALDVNVPLDENGFYHLPPAVDPDAIVAAIDNTLIPKINEIAADLNLITDSPEDPFRMYLEPNETGVEKRMEVDYAEVLVLKGALAGAKAALKGLGHPAYDIFVDLYAAPFNGVIGPGSYSINSLLAQYPDLLQVLPTSNSSANGAARLVEAKQEILAALNTANAVLDFIVAEEDDQTDDLLQVDVTDPGYAPARARLSQLQTSLINGTAATYLFGSKQLFALRQGAQTIGELSLEYGGPLGTEGEEGWLRQSVPVLPADWWDIGSFEVDGPRIWGWADAETGTGIFWSSFEGTISPDGRQITGLTFNISGYYYAGGGYNNTISGLAAEQTDYRPIEVQFNPNPVFAATVSPRDMLPQFDPNNEAIRGTVGHGRGDDATLGGVFPLLTQQDWSPYGFEVWAGNTDYTGAPGHWKIFENIDQNQYGYASRGESVGGSLTISGTYDYYVIAARGRFRLDSIQGSDGSYYSGPLVTGNTQNPQNITGAPDGQYATVGEDDFLNIGGDTFSGYVVVKNPGTWTGLKIITGTENWVLHDWNGDGIVSIIGDVPPFVQCVYFNNCPSGVDPLTVGDCNQDGILSIIGDVPCFVDCVYFQRNCPE